MSEEKLASFNPDEASGLLDNARVFIRKIVVDLFASKKGDKYVNVDVTYEGGGQTITEHYLLGGADQWAPNAAKTGAIPVTEGGRVWNKSDAFKLCKSIIDAGFPKAKVGGDLTVLVGTEVHVNRVTQEGQTYKDKEGKERQRTTLLVTKLYTSKEDIESGAYAKGGVKASTKSTVKTSTTTPTGASGGDNAENDAYVSELLVEILAENGNTLAKDKLASPAFIKITKAKKASIRQAVQERLVNDAFLGSLVEQGLIAYDGKTVSLAS